MSSFPLQLLGINGAFLTGDLFNLFVFFEILLIASYCLAMHGQGPERTRNALRYVVLNLIGSSLFLIALGVLYGACGTLNMADLAIKVAGSTAGSGPAAARRGLAAFDRVWTQIRDSAAVPVASGSLRRSAAVRGRPFCHHDQGRRVRHPAHPVPDLHGPRPPIDRAFAVPCTCCATSRCCSGISLSPTWWWRD
jgi:hypothetical protein